jgi:hypothetical protein
MADTTPPTPNPNPDPTPTPPAKTKRAPRAPVSKELLDELQLVAAVVAAAGKAGHAALLAKREITPELVADLQSDLAAAQALAGQVPGKAAAKTGATGTEAELRDALVERLQEVQKAVKQKTVRRKDEALLKRYLVGKQLYNSRTALEQAADSFLENLKTDTLPGIDADTVAGIRAALDDYRGGQTEQTEAKSDATKARTTLEAAVADLALRRREIQLAADAAWPASKAANAATRREFGLPADKAMK